jgi:hypothetical protein
MFTDLSIPAYPPKLAFQIGDLVRPRTDRTTLCEVLGAEEEDRIRVRGLDWPSGYSAIISAQEIYLVSHVDREISVTGLR